MKRMDQYVQKMKEQLVQGEYNIQNKACRITEDSSLKSNKLQKQSRASSCTDIFLSRSRNMDAMEKEFDIVDTDQDGIISGEELKTLLESEVVYDHLCSNAILSLFQNLERMSSDNKGKLDKDQFMDIINANPTRVETDTAEHPSPDSELTGDGDSEHYYHFSSVLQFFEAKAAESRKSRNQGLTCEEIRNCRSSYSHNRAATAADAASAVTFIPPPSAPRKIPAHHRIKPH